MLQIKLNPDNPRQIHKEKFEKLKQSIKDFPKMLELRPIVVDKDGVILGGNMRFRALQEMGMEVKDEWIKVADKLTDEERRRFIVEDNLEFGNWDFDILSSNYNTEELLNFGFNEFDLKLDNNIDYQKAWEGMPEFNGQPAFSSYKSIIVHFENENDLNDFIKVVNQKITEKTKYIWFPKKEKEDIKSFEITSNE